MFVNCVGTMILAAVAGSGSALPCSAICGPNCVRFVLEYYERPAQLPELVRELHGADMTAPSTIAQLADALERRGVSVSLHRLEAGSYVDSPFPFIVHINPTESAGGHFLVAYQSKETGCQLLWNGPTPDADTRAMMQDRLSGFVLLTAPPGNAVPPESIRSTWMRWIATGSTFSMFGMMATVVLVRCANALR